MGAAESSETLPPEEEEDEFHSTLFPWLLLVVEAVFWPSLEAQRPVCCLKLDNNIICRDAASQPTSPVRPERLDSILKIRFYRRDAADAGDEAALAAIDIPIAKLREFGAPHHCSLWLGLQEASEPLDFETSLARAQEALAPKLWLTIKPLSPIAEQYTLSPAVLTPAEDTSLYCSSRTKEPRNKSKVTKSVPHFMVNGIMEALRSSNEMVRSLHQALRDQLEVGELDCRLRKYADENAALKMKLDWLQREADKAKATAQQAHEELQQINAQGLSAQEFHMAQDDVLLAEISTQKTEIAQLKRKLAQVPAAMNEKSPQQNRPKYVKPSPCRILEWSRASQAALPQVSTTVSAAPSSVQPTQMGESLSSPALSASTIAACEVSTTTNGSVALNKNLNLHLRIPSPSVPDPGMDDRTRY